MVVAKSLTVLIYSLSPQNQDNTLYGPLTSSTSNKAEVLFLNFPR
jgi:hypothetical protein